MATAVSPLVPTRCVSCSYPRHDSARPAQGLDEHTYRYYVLDAPTVSDADYDRLMRRLQETEDGYPEMRTPSSPTQRVAGTYLAKFTPVERLPMRSLDDVFAADELTSWAERVSTRLARSWRTCAS